MNRGPDSLGALRRVRALGERATVVLGNHDLHLLAVALGHGARRLRKDDTLDDVLGAPDRDAMLEWLLSRPLAVHEGSTTARAGLRADLMVHAGVVPQWSVADTLQLALEVQSALQADPSGVFAAMYGN